MATELIASGTTFTVSDEFAVEAGGSATLFLKGTAGLNTSPLNGAVVVQYKNAANAFVDVLTIKGAQGNAVISGVGTYRVKRPEQLLSVGVDLG